MKSYIDRAFGLIAVMALGFFLGWAATGRPAPGVAAAVLMAVLALLTWRAWQAGPGRRRSLLRERAAAAKALVATWARQPDADDLRRRLQARYGPGDYALELFALHELGPALGASQVLDAWRAHAGRDQLLLCATGPVSAQARSAAHALEKPVVRVLDGAALAKVAAYGDLPLPDPPRRKARRMPLALPQRSRAPAILAYGAVMLAMYLVLGQVLYLVLALSLLALGLLCLRRPGPPEELF